MEVIQVINKSEGNIIEEISTANKTGVQVIQEQTALQEKYGEDYEVAINEKEQQAIEVKDAIIIPVEQKSHRKLSNKTYNLTYNAMQLTDEQILQVDKFDGTTGVLIYKATDVITEKDLTALDSVEVDMFDSKKTPSKRLRSVLYLNWQQDAKGFEDFKNYYVHLMDKIIEHYKSKLPK